MVLTIVFWSLHSKYVILLVLCLVLANDLIFISFYSAVLIWVILLIWKMHFLHVLVVMFVCLNVKPVCVCVTGHRSVRYFLIMRW